jgi:hypothetical protein
MGMGLLGFSPEEWRGLLGSSTDQLPPEGPTAPLFVPPTEAAYGEPTPGTLWNTTPSPLGNFLGGMLEGLASAPKHLYEASARDMERFGDHDFPKESAGPAFDTALSFMGGSPFGFAKTNLALRPAGQFSREVAKETGLEAAGIGQSSPMAGGTAWQPPLGYHETRVPIENVHSEIGNQYSIKPAGQGAFDTPAPRTTTSGSPATTSEEIVRAPSAPMAEFAERYPETAPPVEKYDPLTGKWYPAKQYSEGELRFKPVRDAVREEVKTGNFPPTFDPAERHPATSDNSHILDTQEIRMARPATQEKYEAMARSAEAEERIMNAFWRGQLQRNGGAIHWSDIGQVEKLFIKEYGPDLGPREFRQFAESIAATTAGATPEANFLMAHFARYMKARGAKIPIEGYNIPHPVGSQYVGRNMAQFQKMVVDGHGITTDNPKPYNFLYDLLGRFSSPERRGIAAKGAPTLDGPLIDRRISRLFHPDMTSPPPGSYGHFQSALVDLARRQGVHPQEFRDLVWAGADPHHSTKPLIQIINEAIERTHRITGMARDEIVRRGLIRAEIPLYGLGGILAAPPFLGNDDDKS